MAQRKTVFQTKVLRKLYPAAPARAEDDGSPHAETLTKTTHGKRKTSGKDRVCGNAGKKRLSANPSPRIYTVLPPPPDYNLHSEESVTLPHLESRTGTEDPAEESKIESNEEPVEEKEGEEQKRRRKRRKKKPAALQDCGEDGASLGSESMTSQSQVSLDGGGEHVSRNKKRKLKKKRHKEKLLSMGLMPRASTLEFTYQKDGDEREEEEAEDERRVAELSGFLRTTTEIYMSDTSPHVVRIPQLSATLDDLIDGFASERKPNSVLNQLYSLKTFIQQKETENLEKALKELNNNPFMSAEETTAVVALCKYWITDILPMQRHKTAGLPATHP
ncbi:glutamate-rich protein 1 isoform X2 [Cololabis saira]|uniref:glutamate-rich protein 1 isoform X2 n=1 Tax=Cololabis saira TaxID=129043 RepID=UPI002AD51070|nr:glutamate-rich protein 1 isoform X2 [Cololabis saira]